MILQHRSIIIINYVQTLSHALLIRNLKRDYRNLLHKDLSKPANKHPIDTLKISDNDYDKIEII